jgi:hypothetical protein
MRPFYQTDAGPHGGPGGLTSQPAPEADEDEEEED